MKIYVGLEWNNRRNNLGKRDVFFSTVYLKNTLYVKEIYWTEPLALDVISVELICVKQAGVEMYSKEITLHLKHWGYHIQRNFNEWKNCSHFSGCYLDNVRQMYSSPADICVHDKKKFRQAEKSKWCYGLI